MQTKKQAPIQISDRLSTMLNIHNRTIVLPMQIGSRLFADFSQCLSTLEALSPDEPIHIQICNIGGNTDVALGMIARIEQSPCPIHTYAMGTVCSAALYLTVAGDVRHAHILTNFMHHQPSVGFDRASFDSIEHDIKHFERQFMQTCAWLGSRTSKTRDFWYKSGRSGKDFYFTTEDALKMGVCDKVMGT